jgi:hypothetical protein
MKAEDPILALRARTSARSKVEKNWRRGEKKSIPHFIVLTINKRGGPFLAVWKSFRIHSFVRRRKVTGIVTLRVTEFQKLRKH